MAGKVELGNGSGFIERWLRGVGKSKIKKGSKMEARMQVVLVLPRSRVLSRSTEITCKKSMASLRLTS